MKTRLFLLLFFSFIIFFCVSAQRSNKKISITGRVTDLYSCPIYGALIMIDGKTTPAKTDDKGFYKLKVKTTASHIGVFTTTFGVKEVPINGRSVINFNLDQVNTIFQGKDTSIISDDVVNEGYGFTKKGSITRPVSKTDVSGKEYSSFSSIYDVLRTLPNVNVSGNSVTVRGVATTGNTSPLFVVNGVAVSSINTINPSMIKTIEVLKGSSASVYGVQGANGVILIQLK